MSVTNWSKTEFNVTIKNDAMANINGIHITIYEYLPFSSLCEWRNMQYISRTRKQNITENVSMIKAEMW